MLRCVNVTRPKAGDGASSCVPDDGDQESESTGFPLTLDSARSVLLLPLFADARRTKVAGVAEIAQASSTMPFTNMVEVLSDAFKVGLA